MSILSDPAYIVHNLRLSNLRLDDRTSDKVITFPPQPQLFSNEYIKSAGPTFLEMQYCYSPNVNHSYMTLGNNSLLLGSGESGLSNPNDSSSQHPRLGIVGRVKHDRRRMVAAQAAAAAAAAGLGRAGIEGGAPNAFPNQPAPAPAMRVPVPMIVASMDSDDDIDIEDDEPIKSISRGYQKSAIPAHVGENFAPGIFVTTPSRPGSATLPEDSNLTMAGSTATASRDELKITSESETRRESLSKESELLDRDTEIGDITVDSINSPIDLSPPDVTTAGRLGKDLAPAIGSIMSPVPVRQSTPPTNRPVISIVDRISPAPILQPKTPPKSLLTALLNQQNTKEDNPFAEEFLRVAGMGETNPANLKIYLPSSDKPKEPMQVIVKREATIEDVIGYILYQYCHEVRTPVLSEELSSVVRWNLRIVEDDGEIDDDLPAVDRTLKIGKFAMDQRFAMNQFALCEATPAQVQINENLYAKSGRAVKKPKPSASISGLGPPKPSGSTADLQINHESGQGPLRSSGNPNGLSTAVSSNTLSTQAGSNANRGASHAGPLITSTQHYVRVRLHTGHEVSHTTTVEILPKMQVSGVIDYICHKHKMNSADWLLVVSETNHPLPLDGVAEDIPHTTELSLVPKSSVNLNPKQKFGRAGVTEFPGSSVSYLTSTEVYKEYTLNRKRRGGYVGHHEQILTIDVEYVRIMPSTTKTHLLDNGKTSSYHKDSIFDCRQSRKAPSHFKLIVLRGDREKKTYEFEAKSQQQAQEICQRIMQLKGGKE